MTTPPGGGIDAWAQERRRMVDQQIRARGIVAPRILAAMQRVPRHLFVPPAYRDLAYADRPLPIGSGQTISQPYMVALMLDAAALDGTERVLDVGTGSGYQAALLAELAREVISIEIVGDLVERARTAMAEAGAQNVTLVHGDGSVGWPDGAPYDAILVAAAAPRVPPELVEQLLPGGRLILPVGPADGTQLLTRVLSTPAGPRTQTLDACVFVPLTGERGIGGGVR